MKYSTCQPECNSHAENNTSFVHHCFGGTLPLREKRLNSRLARESCAMKNKSVFSAYPLLSVLFVLFFFFIHTLSVLFQLCYNLEMSGN